MHKFFKKYAVVMSVAFVLFIVFYSSSHSYLDIIYYIAMMFGLYIFGVAQDDT